MKYLTALIFVFSVLNLFASIEPKKEEVIPTHIQKWLDDKTASKKGKVDKKGFFKRDSIRIVGYIKGYPKAASFASGIVYHSNDIVREDLPTTVRIFEDGRFECSMIGVNPISSYINFNNRSIKFYAEPGNTTGIVLDWKNLTKDIRYLGPTKSINDGLASIDVGRVNYGKLVEIRKTQKPNDFKKDQLLNWVNGRRSADSVMLAKRTPAVIRKMKENEIDLMYAVYLFDYGMSRKYYLTQEPNNEILKMPMPDDYFDFVNKIDLDDPSLLISDDFSTFINRYEFSPAFETKILYNNSRDDDYTKLDSAFLTKNKKTNLVYDIAKLRSLTSMLGFSQYKMAKYTREFSDLSRSINEPFLVAELSRVYEQYKIGKSAYDLPNSAAANVFKKIVNPLKGKILIVDFWAQWCGPCRAAIEESLALRTKYKDNPDFDYVFVTDSESTEASFYQDYIKKNLMTNTHRVSPDEYLALRELFKFNGIPRYVLVDAEGKIQDDNFQSHNMESEFNKYFPEKFKPGYWK